MERRSEWPNPWIWWQGLAEGISGRAQILEVTLPFSRSIAVADPLSTRYLSAFKDLTSSSVPPEQHKVLVDRAVEINRRGIAPAYSNWITLSAAACKWSVDSPAILEGVCSTPGRDDQMTGRDSSDRPEAGFQAAHSMRSRYWPAESYGSTWM
jgi:hypothetical protein